METGIQHTIANQPSAVAKTGKRSVVLNLLRSLSPGIITAALVFGPSKITIATKLGAQYGFDLLWVAVLAVFFMGVFTSMGARIGIATSQSLLSTIRQRWGQPVALAAGIGIFLVSVSFQAGNCIGLGIALATLSNTAPAPWIILFNAFAIGLLFFRSFYKVLEKLMLVLILLMLTGFLTTVILSKPGMAEVSTGFIPKTSTGSMALVTAFIASCFSIVAAFYQAYLIQERKRLANGAVVKDKSFTGIFILGLMAVMVMICGAMVLHPQGIRVNNASDMARAMEPLFGRYASVLFLCGLFAASFSALVGNSTLGGTLLGDALGKGSSLHSSYNKTLIALIMLIGASIAVIFGKMPIEVIVFAQTITIFIVPFIGWLMYRVANSAAIMGEYKNTWTVKILGAVGLLLVTGLALDSLRNLFFKN